MSLQTQATPSLLHTHTHIRSSPTGRCKTTPPHNQRHKWPGRFNPTETTTAATTHCIRQHPTPRWSHRRRPPSCEQPCDESCRESVTPSSTSNSTPNSGHSASLRFWLTEFKTETLEPALRVSMDHRTEPNRSALPVVAGAPTQPRCSSGTPARVVAAQACCATP
jgi:hypothetical protein